MDLITLGLTNKIKGNIAEEYDSTRCYVKGYIVMYGGEMYECKTTITTAEEWNSAHWTHKIITDYLHSTAVPSSLAEIASIVRAGTITTNSKNFHIGDQIVIPWKDMDDSSHNTNATAYQTVWNVVHHGLAYKNGVENPVPTMFIQMNLATSYGVQYSHAQAFYENNNDTALAAGTYSIGFGVKYNDTFPSGSAGKFTLTQTLPINGRLVLNESKVEAWASATAVSYTESVDFTSIDSTDGTTYLGMITSSTAKSTDGLNAMQRILNGHNRWSTSAARQWLNGTGTGWFSSQEEFDLRPDQYSKYGFLSGFGDDFLSAIGTIKITTALNEPEYNGISEETYDKVFLPSLKQMNIASQSASVDEGEYFEYWREALGVNNYIQTGTPYNVFKINAINTSSPQFIRLRSAYLNNDKSTWLIYSSGNTSSSDANAANRFAPVVAIC